jgi:hypothetical protein
MKTILSIPFLSRLDPSNPRSSHLFLVEVEEEEFSSVLAGDGEGGFGFEL